LYDELFARLRRSKFRARFHLAGKDREYVGGRTPEVLAAHARDLITKRLAPAKPRNDGKQTPYRGHPVFVAQHATATCCRSCLQKWHGIPAGHELTLAQQDHIVDVLLAWIYADFSLSMCNRTAAG
jgi:hypothetical protein